MDCSPQGIRLEARQCGKEPRAVDLKCRSVEWIEATWHDMIGATGSAVRCIVEGPRLIASGLSDFDEDVGWNWLIHPKHGEHEITKIEKSGGEARFVLR
jgi:hypothetical protein